MIKQEDINLINQGLVDSRVKETAGHPVKTFPGENWERVYCIFCSKEDGWVTRESAEYVKIHNAIRICDQCIAAMGELPMQEVPKEFIHER